LLREKEKLPCRLIAVRASPEVARQNLKEARERAASRGKTLSRAERERCHWHLLETNLSASELSVEKVFSVMSDHVLGLKELSEFFNHSPDRRHIRMDPHNKRQTLADLWLQLKSCREWAGIEMFFRWCGGRWWIWMGR